MQIPDYDRTESETPPVQTPNTPDPVQQIVETPVLERDDQNYTPPRTPGPVEKCSPRERNPPLQGRERECHKRSKIVIHYASQNLCLFTFRRPYNLM